MCMTLRLVPRCCAPPADHQPLAEVLFGDSRSPDDEPAFGAGGLRFPQSVLRARIAVHEQRVIPDPECGGPSRGRQLLRAARLYAVVCLPGGWSSSFCHARTPRPHTRNRNTHRDHTSDHHFSYWIYVDDVDGTFADLTTAGAPTEAEPKTEPWGERVASVRDPDGNVVHFGMADEEQRWPSTKSPCP